MDYTKFKREANGDIVWEDGYRMSYAKRGDTMGDKISVVIEPSVFNSEGINSVSGLSEIRKFIYRPQCLKEYIGQENAKNLIKLNIRKINEVKPVHFLISGNRGHGKSTLAYIIKNMLNAKMIERIGKQLISNDDIIKVVNEINSSTEKNVILFIDEIHSLDQALCEIFYPIMEDFRIAGKAVKPFILIGATTERHILVKNNAPFVDRFQVQIRLNRYSVEDIVTILTQYKNQLYPQYKLDSNFIQSIAENSKRTPRIGISLLEDGIIEPDVKYILKCHQIVKDGLTDVDMNILRILIENNKPMGSKSISQMVGISEKDYLVEAENYLVEQEYILRTSRGRMIGKKGKEFYETCIK